MKLKSKEKAVAAPAQPAQDGFSLISNAKLMQLYFTMLKCRLILERARALMKQSQLSQDSLAAQDASWGQEAVAVGVAIDLLPEDSVMSHPGDFIPFFIRDLQVSTLFRMLFNPSAPLSDTTTQLKFATDAAMLNKLASNGRIAVALSNRSVQLGPWQKALAFAGRHNLPLIFVSWNHRLPKQRGFRFPSIAVDGNDVVAIYRVASEAIAYARNGSGPTLIDCQTRRPLGQDPIQNMEKYLTQKGLFRVPHKLEEMAKFIEEMDVPSVILPPTSPADASDRKPASTGSSSAAYTAAS
jgi:TPP-dependent pyruvate/acetoin dehydrogenase alpha subunit